MNKKTIAELSVDAQLLISKLKQVEKGQTVTYEELSKTISGNVLGKDRYAMERAKHRLMKDERIVFECVRKVGLRRIADADHAGIGLMAISKVRRLSRRSAEKMMCAEYDSLNSSQKVDYNTNLSILGALAMVTKNEKTKQISAAVEASKDRLPLSTTLQIFSK